VGEFLPLKQPAETWSRDDRPQSDIVCRDREVVVVADGAADQPVPRRVAALFPLERYALVLLNIVDAARRKTNRTPGWPASKSLQHKGVAPRCSLIGPLSQAKRTIFARSELYSL
jgi:hypothetical protein